MRVRENAFVTLDINGAINKRRIRQGQPREVIEPYSPIGKAIMGKEKGEQVEVETPGGTALVKIIDVSR